MRYFGESCPLAQPHDEDIIARRITVEEFHPAYIKYRQIVQQAWRLYQDILDKAWLVREQELPHEELIEMAQGKKKMTFMKDKGVIAVTKQIISVSLSEEAIENIDKYSEALGKSRSEFIDWYINVFFTSEEIDMEVKEILSKQEVLHKKLFGDIK